MITLSLVLILPVSSVIMGLLGFWVGRCARKLPIIDNNLPWTLHRSQIPAAAEEDPVKSGPSSDRWPRGKLSRIVYFPGLGYNAADTDDGWCRPMPDGRQRWRDDAIERPLAVQGAGVLFVAGCEENQVRFQPRFDVIVLLSAPAEVLAGRHGNPEPVTRTARRSPPGLR